MIFVEEAEVYRERWYWLDKRVANVQRHMRLVFQPLIRRWRLSMGSGPVSNTEPGVALAQNFDTLEEALAVDRGVCHAGTSPISPIWKLACATAWSSVSAWTWRSCRGRCRSAPWARVTGCSMASASRRLQPESLK